MHQIIQKWLGFDKKNKDLSVTRHTGTHSMRHEHLEDRRMLATLTVSVDYDGLIDTDDGTLTLREAIAYVNGDAQPELPDLSQIDLTEAFGTNDKIVFDPSLFVSGDPTKAKIELMHAETSSSALVISNDVIIEAPDGYEVEIAWAGSDDRRVFEIPNFNVTTGVTLRNLAVTFTSYRNW